MKIKNIIFWVMISFLLVVKIDLVVSTGSIHYISDNDILIPNYELLPYKDQRGEQVWSIYINDYNLSKTEWNEDISEIENSISYKCLSYAASYINDWFATETGKVLSEYDSYIHDNWRGQENGTNPRELENLYYFNRYNQKNEGFQFMNTFDIYSIEYESNKLYVQKTILAIFEPLITINKRDPVTNEEIPINLNGYADILTNNINYGIIKDTNLPDKEYIYFDSKYLNGFKYKPLGNNYNEIKNAIKKYEILVTASDGNLSDSQYITVTVLRNDSTLTNQFDTNEYYLEFNESTTKSITLNNMSRVWLANLRLEGYSDKVQTDYQEVTPVVIEANVFNISANLTTDKDWNTYYSAGSETGAIVELQDNTNIPANLGHIIFRLRLKVGNGGHGRFGAYNYISQYYEIVTSTIPAFNESYKDIYFDIYKESPLWATNNTHFSLKADNINNFLNTDDVRWYYRYIDDLNIQFKGEAL